MMDLLGEVMKKVQRKSQVRIIVADLCIVRSEVDVYC